ncbi:hypothetical protein [Streptomyces sp. NPDC086023]|uniref:hypothetical protein n=1 Tax=Streptomyces sp. NPDC086023 TaxID=3365746 RepID=UPI0037D47C51
MTTQPTDLPGRPMFDKTIPVPLAQPAQLFLDARGGLWRLAEDGEVGSRRFVPAEMDPTTVPRLAWARENELVGVVGELHPVERAA